MVTITQTEADIHVYQMENVAKRVVDLHGGRAVEQIGGSMSIEVQE